ncbi:ABC transporter permease [Bacillus nakamurai]|uniref:ABC transporter permease n=1 Tax=Bacillus nakamurai TaxID=1793963 RepID=UPI001E655D1C|nr:ABC transporter permease [Bacillus nakamurai]MCC9022361.1 ABC transporter permease [Bacillus nakamurai]
MSRIIIATIKRNYIVSKRVFPWSFIIARVLMGIYVSVFAFFTFKYMFDGKTESHFLKYSNGIDYISFVVLGAGLYTYSISIIMNVGRSLMLENIEGTLESILVSPCSRLGYFLGVFFEQIGRSSLEFLIVIFFSLYLGANIKIENTIQVLIVIIIITISLFSIGIFIATLMLFLRDTFITQNTLFIVIGLVSGVSFPKEYLPNILYYLSYLSPLSYALSLFRSVMTGQNILNDHTKEILGIFVLSLAYCLLGLLWLKCLEKKILENTFN